MSSSATHSKETEEEAGQHCEGLNIKEWKGILALWTYVESERRSSVQARIGKKPPKFPLPGVDSLSLPSDLDEPPYANPPVVWGLGERNPRLPDYFFSQRDSIQLLIQHELS